MKSSVHKDSFNWLIERIMIEVDPSMSLSYVSCALHFGDRVELPLSFVKMVIMEPFVSPWDFTCIERGMGNQGVCSFFSAEYVHTCKTIEAHSLFDVVFTAGYASLCVTWEYMDHFYTVLVESNGTTFYF